MALPVRDRHGAIKGPDVGPVSRSYHFLHGIAYRFYRLIEGTPRALAPCCLIDSSEPARQKHREPARIGLEKLSRSLSVGQDSRELSSHTRILAQARVESATIVTHDRALEAYGIPIIWT